MHTHPVSPLGYSSDDPGRRSILTGRNFWTISIMPRWKPDTGAPCLPLLLGRAAWAKRKFSCGVVNRLFWEQDHHETRRRSCQFNFSFPDEILSRQDFAHKYVENFVRWYAAFRLRNPDLLKASEEDVDLIAELKQSSALSEPFRQFALGLLKAIPSGHVILPEEKALFIPRTVVRL